MSLTDSAQHESDSMHAPLPEETKKRLRFLPIVVLAAGAAVAYIFARDYLSLETVSANRVALVEWRNSNLMTASLAFVAIYIAAVAFSVPGAIWLTLAGGFLFGTVLAAALTVFAATTGATLIFLAARSSLGAMLHERAGPWLRSAFCW
jgi:uncharacterized membrane protein YdjX (TVP38/TMEM64 family)